MKWNSIRTKVLTVMAGCLIVGVTGVLILLQYSFARNSRAIATDSVTGAQRLFGILEARETSKMVAVSEALATNPEVREALAERNRDRLLGLTAALFSELKMQGITNWMFHTADPEAPVFLRLHNPGKFGDSLGRFMDKEVVRTQTTVAGNELAKAGFAARILRPFYDSRGQLTGYIEFGEEIGHFIHEMKVQTGDDYGLLLNKKFVDRKFWADTNATLKRRDNWNDHPTFVIADVTSASERTIQFDGDLASVSGKGQALERYESGRSVLVRGLFPIYDTAHNTVGAMFVVHDISGIYISMRDTQRTLMLLSIVGLVLGSGIVTLMLSRLVFDRLRHIITVVTRVVGGDFESAIGVESDDEIGQFEELFDQFRRVFVNVLHEMTELQEYQSREKV